MPLSLTESSEDLTLIVADTLRGQGYDVITAADGIQGLEKFKSEGADIVVADVMMPKMDGFTMAKEIRKLSPTVPLLFLTAKSTISQSVSNNQRQVFLIFYKQYFIAHFC